MQSFRTEIENPLVEKDLIELERKIQLFKEGKIDEEKFRSLRLARGVYGQRQPGVQMIRIKIPYGKLTTEQLLRISDVSDEYSRGRLHTTTRQDIQIHHVSLDRTPQLWADLEKSNITLREACGNAVRNVTGSPLAGIDQNEIFDISPYAQATFEYFLRQPFGQDLGRKFKIAFSGNEDDTGLTFINDLGFIAKSKIVNNKEIRGFRVLLAGGLGAQAFEPKELYDFLPEDRVIPLIESTLRVFDRHGERAKRHKARIKYLIKDIGLEKFTELIREEELALKHSSFPIESDDIAPILPLNPITKTVEIENQNSFDQWKKSNVIPQKQKGYFAVAIKLQNGDFYTDQARELVHLVNSVAADDIRITPDQNLILKYILEDSLPHVFSELQKIGLADNGYQSTVDVTACPGTDTCNLGISNSTGTSIAIENHLRENYRDLIFENNLKIKISGCMNACGQHTIADIGLHGSSSKSDGKVLPALQILLGGSLSSLGEKVIKIPSKRIEKALDIILQEFNSQKAEKESFKQYYERTGKIHFYNLLKPLGSLDNLLDSDFSDWGNENKYIRAVGVGECAGVVIDLVATLFLEVEEKLEDAKLAFYDNRFADSIYFSYSAIVNTCKALLMSDEIRTNTQVSIIDKFIETYIDQQKIKTKGNFNDFVFQIRTKKASEEFAINYLKETNDFYQEVKEYKNQLELI